jgi:hypothetical protein
MDGLALEIGKIIVQSPFHCDGGITKSRVPCIFSGISTMRLQSYPGYRADVDGLRALAVLAVIGFHAFPEWVRGGFVGVDIFYVTWPLLLSVLYKKTNRVLPVLCVLTLLSFVWNILVSASNPNAAFYLPQTRFWGDSNIQQYAPRISSLINENPDRYRSALFATCGGCPPMPGVREGGHRLCSDLVDNVLDLANAPDVDAIVIGAPWKAYFPMPDAKKSSLRYYYYGQDGSVTGIIIENGRGQPLKLENSFHF